MAAPAGDISMHILVPNNAVEPRKSARTRTASKPPFKRIHMVIQLLRLTAKGAWWGGVRKLIAFLRSHVSVIRPYVVS